MAESDATAADVLEGLAGEGLLDRSRIPAIAESLAKPPTEFPWILQHFMSAGAWVAAFSFIAFLSIARLITHDAGSLIPWGIGLIAAATLMRRRSVHPFLAQVCLAFSVAGHILFLSGVGDASRHLTAVAAASVGLAALLYPLYRDAGHRFLSVVGAAVLTIFAAVEPDPDHAVHAVVLAEAAILAGLLRRRHLPPSLQPLMYGCAVGLLATLWVFAVPQIETPEWPARIVTGVGLVAAVSWAARGALRLELLVPAALFAAVASPGMSAALALMILGRLRGERLLEAIGTAFFPAFLFFYYYSLNATLLVKSLVLMGSGVILLGGMAWVEFRFRRREAAP